MANKSKLNFRVVASSRLTGRMRQAIVLLLTIIIGIMISITLEAQPVTPAHNTPSCSKYKSQMIDMNHACEILKKKELTALLKALR